MKQSFTGYNFDRKKRNLNLFSNICRMLSYDPCDPYRGFFLDTYKLPSGCSCHIPDGPAPVAVAAPVVPEAARSAAAAPISPVVPVAQAAASEPKPLVGHMWLMGCPNPYELQQKWECIFLKFFTHINIK